MGDREPVLSCSRCSPARDKMGKTYCWNYDPEARPPQPAHCPSAQVEDLVQASFDAYQGDAEDARMARVAAKVEGFCYQRIPGSRSVSARWTRVEDTIAFAKLMGYRRIGIATCIGLLDEASLLAKILEGQGLEPQSVCCKTGSVDKTEIGVEDRHKIRPGTFEAACNPVGQAQLLNEAGTDMNVIVGLCVGHDMLFTKYSHAPVTTLVAKDRVTGHNPVAALYGTSSYYKRLFTTPIEIPE